MTKPGAEAHHLLDLMLYIFQRPFKFRHSHRPRLSIMSRHQFDFMFFAHGRRDIDDKHSYCVLAKIMRNGGRRHGVCGYAHLLSLFRTYCVSTARTLDSFGTEKLITFYCELILKGRLRGSTRYT